MEDIYGLPNIPKKIKIIEVCTRDGFQSEKNIIPTKDKIEIVNALSKANLSAIEVTSFVHPKVVPQLADAEDVMNNIDRNPNTIYSALVPNLKGAERALKCGVNEWGLMLSLSESHSKANVNKSMDDMVKEIEKIVELAKINGIRLNGGLITALGCPFEGKISIETIFYSVDMYIDLGINIINVADTAGVSDPAHTYYVMKELTRNYPNVEFVMHFHDTRNMAMANVIAAMQAGVYTFDTSLGGIGGCPFIPGASGNLSTEDLVHMLDLMNIETGINLDYILNISKRLSKLLGRKLDSKVLIAGKSSDLKSSIDSSDNK